MDTTGLDMDSELEQELDQTMPNALDRIEIATECTLEQAGTGTGHTPRVGT